MPRIAIVVPCYNEAERLPVAAFASFASAHGEVDFVLVDDGSTDRTLECLRGLAERNPSQFSVLDLQPNRGKAEAVRAGILRALKGRPDCVGFLDADLATPLEAIPDLARVLDERPTCHLVFGSRVKLLGRAIERDPVRHYAGRVFATLASVTLGLPVYDTQCGAKLFRATPAVAALFEEPFQSGWIFDVEIIARWIRDQRVRGVVGAAEAIYELPLREWKDVAGSKVRATDFVRGIWALARIRRRYLRRVPRNGSGGGERPGGGGSGRVGAQQA